MQETLESERAFHNQRFGGDDRARAALLKYYSINVFLHRYYRGRILELCNGADLLEYGCGTGESAFFWAENGARVTGIDISDEGLKKAEEEAARLGLNVSLFQSDAEDLRQLQSSAFDLVTGSGILHHLRLEKAYSELARVLRKDGRAVFIEPLGHNPVVNLYRRLTPSLRTRDEHPLLLKDIEEAGKHFENVNVKYFHLITLVAVPFRRLFFFKQLLAALNMLDKGLMVLIPYLKRFAWLIVIEMHGPRK